MGNGGRRYYSHRRRDWECRSGGVYQLRKYIQVQKRQQGDTLSALSPDNLEDIKLIRSNNTAFHIQRSHPARRVISHHGTGHDVSQASAEERDLVSVALSAD